MRWFENYRQDWIAEMLIVYGFINREHLRRKFGISIPQASNDLRQFQKRFPDGIAYNATTKRYEFKSAGATRKR